MKSMFCYQCQETAQNTGCTVYGACGKNALTASKMDQLIRQLKRLAATRKPDTKTGLFICQSLFMTLTNANFDVQRLEKQLKQAEALTGLPAADAPLSPQNCPDEDIRSLREFLTYGLKGVAAYAVHAAALGKEDLDIYGFVFKSLNAMTHENTKSELLDLIMECGSTAVSVLDLLDKANTEAYGPPELTEVNIDVGARPGILVSGHDLNDLEELLEQTKDQGIDIYTHGEMLVANSYPFFKKYPHLHGNYGNAWYKQNVEFAKFNGPILMTSNCITPVQDSYRHRIFTTGVAGYPGIPHIEDGSPKDFTPLINLAKKCPPPQLLETGRITIGFAHHQVLALTDKIVTAVKSGAIRRFIVMAGCDGRHQSRSYYTEVASKLPKDTIILTAGCAKFRYNKLDLGSINGIPRVLDAGQCNDCYSLALVAFKLMDALGMDSIAQLPLSFDIAWYEQKAVVILLALLTLGFKNIRLGPTLPAFLSPRVAKILAQIFHLKGITTPEEDIAAMLNPPTC